MALHRSPSVFSCGLRLMEWRETNLCAVCFYRYVNAKWYFEDVANAMEAAKEEIFITDWWFVLT